MNILISNDDGIHATGIQTLIQTLKPHHSVSVIAPDRDRSGTSSALTLTRPLHVITQADGQKRVDGFPADCVHLGIKGALSVKPDIVVSGINHGPNMGDDILCSGTVAAAMAGRFLVKPGLAISLDGHKHFATAAAVTLRLISQLDSLNLPQLSTLNVNVPDIPLEDIKGFKVTRLGEREQGQRVIPAQDPRGRECYWVGTLGKMKADIDGTDFHAVAQGYVSITILSPDMANTSATQAIQNWLTKLI